MSNILGIGDTHFPYHCKKAFKHLVKRIESETFTHIIQVGDLYDQYAFSRFSKKNLMLPEQELNLGRVYAEEMWAFIKHKQPDAKLIQILGNHDERFIKRVQERVPEVQEVIQNSIMNYYRFTGVKTVDDPREEYQLGDIAVLHGYRSKLGDHTKYMQQNTMHGHTHKGGVYYHPLNGKVLWELDCGYLADKSAEPLMYTPQKHSNSIHGWGEVNEGVPRFIPVYL